MEAVLSKGHWQVGTGFVAGNDERQRFGSQPCKESLKETGPHSLGKIRVKLRRDMITLFKYLYGCHIEDDIASESKSSVIKIEEKEHERNGTTSSAKAPLSLLHPLQTFVRAVNAYLEDRPQNYVETNKNILANVDFYFLLFTFTLRMQENEKGFL